MMNFIISLLSPFLIHASTNADTIYLYPGLSYSLKTHSRQILQIEKKGIVKAKDNGSSITLVGLKSGQTQLQLGRKTIPVIVVKESLYQTYEKLRDWKKDILGPHIRLENQRAVIDGKIHTFLDWLSLKEIMNDNDDYIIQADIPKDIQGKINDYIEDLCHKNNIAFGVLHLQPQWEILLNSLDKDSLSTYKRIFAPLGIKISASTQTLSEIPMIEVSILAAEVRRSELSNIGVSWPKAADFQILPKLGLSSESVFASVNLFEQQGWGKVLASPTLLAQSGKEATFHSGGEFPLKNSNRYNSSVTWKQYGIRLKIKPKADYTGKMSIDIECEVSMLDHASAVDGIPGLLSNRISSHFNLNETKTIALSGLIKDEWGETQSGLPGFKNIPIFSQLFSSKDFHNNQSELIFFVTPRIVR